MIELLIPAVVFFGVWGWFNDAAQRWGKQLPRGMDVLMLIVTMAVMGVGWGLFLGAPGAVPLPTMIARGACGMLAGVGIVAAAWQLSKPTLMRRDCWWCLTLGPKLIGGAIASLVVLVAALVLGGGTAPAEV